MVKIILNESQVKYIIDNLVNEQQEQTIFQYPGDKNWDYTLIRDKWYTRRIGTDKWIRLSDNPKYQSSVDKLDKQFPNARPNTQLGGIPTRNTGPSYNKTPDFNTELPTPEFKDPNRFIDKRKNTINEQAYPDDYYGQTPTEIAIDKSKANYSLPEDYNDYITLPFSDGLTVNKFLNFLEQSFSLSEKSKNLVNRAKSISPNAVFYPQKFAPAKVDELARLLYQLINKAATWDNVRSTFGKIFREQYPKSYKPFRTKVLIQTKPIVQQQAAPAMAAAAAKREADAEAAAAAAKKPTIQWRTNDVFPIKLYDKSVKYITPLQQILGLPVQQQRGYFGPITLQKLKEKGVIIDPEIGIRSIDEFNNAVNTLRKTPESMDKMTSIKQPRLGNNKIDTTKLA
jgi:hypothetical protein